MEQMERLPERGDGHGIVVRRWTVDDGPTLHALVAANVEHLRSRMAWIPENPVDLAARRAQAEAWEQAWLAGGDVVLGIFVDGVAVGGTGLHRRRGPGILEVGYWVDRRRLREGIATRAAAVATDLAFTVPGIEAVAILHDVENVASRGVPARLGFTCVGEEASTRPLAPADTGRDVVWRLERTTWLACGRRTLADGA